MSSPENTLDPRALGSAGSPLGGDGVVYDVGEGGKPARFPDPAAVVEVVALVTLETLEPGITGFMIDSGSVRRGLGRSGRSGGAAVAAVMMPVGLTASLMFRTSAASSSSLLETIVSNGSATDCFELRVAARLTSRNLNRSQGGP